MYLCVQIDASDVMSVVEVPSSVRDVAVEGILADSVTLSWLPPLSDGGAPIDAFIVEKCDAKDPQSVFEPAAQADGGATSVQVGGLTEGTEYQFRVSARNAAGVSESPALLETPVVPKKPIG